MIKKRFVPIGVEWTDGFVQDHEDDKDLFSINAVCDLLNELQDKSDKKQAHIVLLEGKIHRMREDIKRLEALYHYRGYIGSGDVKKEYYRREKLLKAESDQLKQAISDWKGSYDELYQDMKVLEKENEQLKEENQTLSEQKHIYKQDWKHVCIDKELLDSENEALKEDNAILKHALSRIISEFDEHIAKNSDVRDLIK